MVPLPRSPHSRPQPWGHPALPRSLPAAEGTESCVRRLWEALSHSSSILRPPLSVPPVPRLLHPAAPSPAPAALWVLMGGGGAVHAPLQAKQLAQNCHLSPFSYLQPEVAQGELLCAPTRGRVSTRRAWNKPGGRRRVSCSLLLPANLTPLSPRPAAPCPTQEGQDRGPDTPVEKKKKK